MKKNANEKVINIAANNERSYNEMERRQQKKRRSNIFSNILTTIAVIGLLVGGGILGTTLWNEYQRVELTKEFTREASELIEHKIPRSAFHPQAGDVVGLIIFPQRDNLTVPIVEGTRTQDLYAGIGHYEQTGWPNDQRQIFLSGHRNTEFGMLQNVTVGEEIIMDMAYGRFTYKIVPVPNDGITSELKHAGRIVKETQVEVIDSAPAGEFEWDQLVLMTCYPFTFGASLDHRFLVYAERTQ